jgi:predicted nucleic acid-binding protein
MNGWLIDKSAFARLSRSPDVEVWMDRIERGLVRMSTVTKLEVGYSARSGTAARQAFASAPLAWMPPVFLTPAAEDRACAVQMELADQGRHRAPGVAGLLIAATAELEGLTLLHMDKDFQLIAEVRGLSLARLAWRDDGSPGCGDGPPPPRD